jgi:hypothetical protein
MSHKLARDLHALYAHFAQLVICMCEVSFYYATGEDREGTTLDYSH